MGCNVALDMSGAIHENVSLISCTELFLSVKGTRGSDDTPILK